MTVKTLLLAAALAIATGPACAQASLLHFWTVKGWADEVTRELQRGVNPDVRNEYRQTALHLAAHDCHAEAAHRLLDGGANPNARDDTGYTPLHYAALEDWPRCVALLLRHGADPNATTDDDVTPLHISVLGGFADSVGPLLEAGADPNVGVEINGRIIMPLSIAESRGYDAIATMLVAAGATH